jgi:hypothetical protein
MENTNIKLTLNVKMALATVTSASIAAVSLHTWLLGTKYNLMTELHKLVFYLEVREKSDDIWDLS